MHMTPGSRVALVAGAAQGIGHAIARGLGEGGCTVVVCDIDQKGVVETATALNSPHYVVDLADRAAVRDLVDDIEESVGPLGIVVNAAGGVCGQTGRPIDQVDESDWHAIFRANVDGAFWLAQAVGPKMMARKRGRIVHIASGAGLRPSLTGIQAYTAAKHALVGLTKQLSLEFAAHGVTVNAVAPGFILSNPSTIRQWTALGEVGQRRLIDSIHTKRLGAPEDIAAAVLFLIGDSAAWITGQVLSVDGGRS